MISLSGTPLSEAYMMGALICGGLIGLGALIVVVIGVAKLIIHNYLEGRPPE